MNRSNPTKRDCRERLIAAAAAVTAEHGYAGVTVERIVNRAGASRASFYSHFANKQTAVDSAYQDLFERYLGQLLQACELQSSWPLKVKVGIGVTLDMAAAAPVDARFLAMEAITVGDDLLRRVLDARDRLARLLAAGRTETPYGAKLPGIIESALVGGIAGVISAQLQAGEAKHLPALAPQLVELTLAPYLGCDKAAEVARRPLSRFEDR